MSGVGIAIPADLSTALHVGPRGKAYRYVVEYLRTRLPGMPIAVGAPKGDDWVKAEAVDDAVNKLGDCDVIVVHDADVLVDISALATAVGVVESGGGWWAVPHTNVRRLTEEATDEWLADGTQPDEITMVRAEYAGFLGGGVTVVRRALWADCPLDRRFVGWGGEDESWGRALNTLYGPPAWRGDTVLWHLWHPHAAPGSRHPLRGECERMRRAYRAADGRVDRMRALVENAL